MKICKFAQNRHYQTGKPFIRCKLDGSHHRDCSGCRHIKYTVLYRLCTGERVRDIIRWKKKGGSVDDH